MTDYLTKLKKRFDKRADKGYYVFPEEEWKLLVKEIKKAEKRSKNQSVEEFAESIKDDLKAIIKWAKCEIKEFNKLIKLVKKRRNET